MQLSEKKLDKVLKNSIKDGAAYSAMDAVTTSYSTPFALALGANNAEVGLLNSVPSLFSTILQPFIGQYIKKIGRKDVCLSMAFLHKLLLIPIIFIPMFFLNEGVFFFILVTTLSNIVLSFANTTWSSMIGSIVPERMRGRYFGKRNSIQSVFSFSTTLIVGWILGIENSLAGFSFVFFLALIFGLISYFFLSKIPDVRLRNGKDKVPFLSAKESKRYKNFGPFKRHMTLLNFAVNLSVPFFTVYMLSVMKIGYEWYGIVVAVEILARIVMQRYWGTLSDRFGDRSVMGLCNVLIIFYPFFFLFVRSPVDLVLIGIFSGIAWSGFDLTSFNYLLDVTPAEDRHIYISKYKFSNGIALFLGPLAGGLISQYLSGFTILWLGGLQILFLASFILRGVVTAYGLPKLKEVRGKRTVPARDVFIKAFAVYPAKGISHELFYIYNQFEVVERRIRKVGRRLNRK